MGAALKLPERYPNRWKPGQSGNVGGMPRLTNEEREAKRLIREGTIRAARRLLKLIDSEDEKMAYAASIAVLDRSELRHAAAQEDGPPVFTLDEQLAAVEAERARLLAEKQGGA